MAYKLTEFDVSLSVGPGGPLVHQLVLLAACGPRRSKSSNAMSLETGATWRYSRLVDANGHTGQIVHPCPAGEATLESKAGQPLLCPEVVRLPD